ncbi:MAG: 2-dehydropantoate 2-reductase [Anaerolineales bacterium]|nr:2-dehydropantoate 2-reductase [Anaerolineales bacterium]
MRFLVIGAGAIGSYVGGSLAAAQHDVTFLARPATASLLRERGLHLQPAPAAAPVSVRRVTAVATVAEALAGSPPDFVILAVKAYDTATTIAQMRAVTTSPPPVLCLQNGVDGEVELARAFGAERVLAGTVTTPVRVPAPGAVAVEKVRGMGIALGLPHSAPLIAALNQAGIATRAYPLAGSMKWSKLLTNLIGNATAASLDLSVGEVFADPRLYLLEAAALRECLAVMRALGYSVVDLPGVPVRLLTLAVSLLPPALARPLLRRGVGAGRGGKMPSLHVDLHAGRSRTEVDWLNGAVVRYGAAHGVPTPVNQMLTATIDGLAEGRLDKANFRRKPEALLQLTRV